MKIKLNSTKSKYLAPWVNQSIIKRLIRWLYRRYVDEPHFPKGKISFFVGEKGWCGNVPKNQIRINYRPDRFIPGMLEDYFFDGSNCEIIIRKNEKSQC
jgi:hypothetical protein